MIRAALLLTCVVAGYKVANSKKKKLKRVPKVKALPPAQPMITLEFPNEEEN